MQSNSTKTSKQERSTDTKDLKCDREEAESQKYNSFAAYDNVSLSICIGI